MMRKIFFAIIIFGVSLVGLDNFSVTQKLQKVMDEKNFSRSKRPRLECIYNSLNYTT
jgi:hypothetical protein